MQEAIAIIAGVAAASLLVIAAQTRGWFGSKSAATIATTEPVVEKAVEQTTVEPATVVDVEENVVPQTEIAAPVAASPSTPLAAPEAAPVMAEPVKDVKPRRIRRTSAGTRRTRRKKIELDQSKTA